MTSNDEQQRLQEISTWYSNREWGFYTRLVHMSFRSLAPYFVDGSCLEVGCADGEMTRFLSERFDDLTILDAVPSYVEIAQSIAPGIEGHASLIEEWNPPRDYDNIVFAHVLEHVERPVEMLEKLGGMLTSGGRLHVIVPNALSLHRLAGVKMGLLDAPSDLNEADIGIGHRRVYGPDTLRSDVAAAGLAEVAFGGIFLKPLSNAQIDESWSEELVEAYYQLGTDLPDMCGEIFLVCRPSGR